MGGGLMQLVAYGAQDIYLTGNPQITFFKVVYRRHTNFAMESVEQTLNGSVGFGNKVTATVSRNGDLVGRMYVEADISALADNADEVSANAGTALINEVTCEIGGQQIDKHYGHWLETWAELTEPQGLGMTVVTGSTDAGKHNTGTPYQNMACAGGVAGAALSNSVTAVEKIHVPLQFWFNRNPGLALPLIALQYHEVKVSVTFGASADATSETDASLAAKLWADYIYLDTDERRRFAQVSHEYLIEQVQFQSYSSSDSMDLTFNHPVKELVWTGINDTAATTTGASTPAPIDTAGNWKLVLNGHDRFAARTAQYFTRVQVQAHHTGVGGMTPGTAGTNDSIAVYSFALKPEEHQPSGTCNFSRIDNAQLKCDAGAAGNSTNVYAVNYNVLRVMSGMGGLAYSN